MLDVLSFIGAGRCAVGKVKKRLYRWLSTLSAESRQVIIGAGLAFDLFPESRYPTFERSDEQAMKKDWDAVAGDMWWAIDRAGEQVHRRRVAR